MSSQLWEVGISVIKVNCVEFYVWVARYIYKKLWYSEMWHRAVSDEPRVFIVWVAWSCNCHIDIDIFVNCNWV